MPELRIDYLEDESLHVGIGLYGLRVGLNGLRGGR
jgi:hypothetical protein